MKILMVCLGNICRSPMAEGLMRKKIKEHGVDWTVASAGIIANPGQTPHKHAQQVCFTRGVNISAQGARRFRAELLKEYDKIYAMSDDVLDEIRQLCGEDADLSHVNLLMDEVSPGGRDSVPDPLNGPQQWFVIVYDMLDKATDKIIEKYKGNSETNV